MPAMQLYLRILDAFAQGLWSASVAMGIALACCRTIAFMPLSGSFKVLSMSKGETYDKHAAILLDLPQVIMLNLLYLFDLSISQAKYHTVDIACKFNEYCTNRSIVHQALPSMLGALHANMHIPSCSVCYCDFFCSPYSVITYMIAPSLDT